MKALFTVLGFMLISGIAIGQDFIKMDNAAANFNFSAEWKTAIFNQAVVVKDSKGQPVMLISLPSNGNHSPVAGTFAITEGKKRAVKKGSQTAKIEFEPGYISADDAGSLIITEHDGIFSFTADNIIIIDTKTGDRHKLSFNIGMFIEKK